MCIYFLNNLVGTYNQKIKFIMNDEYNMLYFILQIIRCSTNIKHKMYLLIRITAIIRGLEQYLYVFLFNQHLF